MALETTKNAKGNAKGNKWAIVIDPPKENAENSQYIATLDNFQDTLLNYNGFSFIATIIHDKDINEDGTNKLVHLHAYIETPLTTDKSGNKTDYTKAQLITLLCDLLHTNKESISCNPTNSDILYPQYLIHKNDINKFQYSSDLVKSNNLTKYMKLINTQYNQPLDKLAIEKILVDSNTIIEVMQQLGVDLANKYRGLYKDIKADKDNIREIQRLNVILDSMQLENEELHHLLNTLINRAELYLPRELKTALSLDTIKDRLERLKTK